MGVVHAMKSYERRQWDEKEDRKWRRVTRFWNAIDLIMTGLVVFVVLFAFWALMRGA